MPTEAIISVVTPAKKVLTVRDIQAWVDEALALGFGIDEELEDYAPLYISRVVYDCYQIQCGDHVYGEHEFDVLVPMHDCGTDVVEEPQEQLPFPKYDFAAQDRAAEEQGPWWWK
jgi:hypothetical protein